MSRLRLLILFTALAVAVVVSAYGAAYLFAASRTASFDAPSGLAGLDLRSDTPSASTQIAFWSARVERHPSAYLDLTLLGQAFARRGRETSDLDSFVRGEAALRRALEVNPGYVPAQAALSGVQLATHDFTGAIATARPIVATPRGAAALGTLGDAYLALGRYRRAQDAYGRLLAFSPSAAAYSRLAIFASLHGNTEQAARLLGLAQRLVQDAGESGESLAWYDVQLGELAFKAGDLEGASSHFRAALRIFPNYPLALGGLGKATAAEGHLGAAIRLYRHLTAIVPQPDYLAALGQLEEKVGNERAARQQYATVDVVARIARVNRQVYNRQVALVYADRGVHLDVARRLALGELRVRKDVYGYDAAAWTLARSGRCREARPLAARALRLGTKDALLYFHRGYVEGCSGHPRARQTWYARALDLNPSFSVRWAPVARAAVDAPNA